MRLPSKAAKFRHMFIADLGWSQLFGKAPFIELRVGTRSGMDLTSTTKSTLDSLRSSESSAIVLVEYPIVKNLLVMGAVQSQAFPIVPRCR